MSRRLERENALSALYTYLLRKQAIDEVLEDNQFVSSIGDFIPAYNLGEEMIEVVKRAADRKDIYEKVVNHHLKSHWRFERLGIIEQAILLMACSELELAYQDTSIIINEAVRLAKIYGDDDSYKLINGVLDAL